jgi:DNA-binding PadR family transcriptional regulator
VPALDDYAPATPTWLVVCRVLDKSPEPLRLTELQRQVNRRTDGRGGSSATSLLARLARLIDDGVVETTTVAKRGRSLPGYRITDDGRAFLSEALSRFSMALDVTVTPQA